MPLTTKIQIALMIPNLPIWMFLPLLIVGYLYGQAFPWMGVVNEIKAAKRYKDLKRAKLNYAVDGTVQHSKFGEEECAYWIGDLHDPDSKILYCCRENCNCKYCKNNY